MSIAIAALRNPEKTGTPFTRPGTERIDRVRALLPESPCSILEIGARPPNGADPANQYDRERNPARLTRAQLAELPDALHYQSRLGSLNHSEEDAGAAGSTLFPVWLSCRDRRFTAAIYIVETIHTPAGGILVNRHPTLFYPQEAMSEKSIRIFSGKQNPFEKHGADYVLYHVEGYENAGRWRLTRPTAGETSPRAILEQDVARAEA